MTKANRMQTLYNRSRTECHPKPTPRWLCFVQYRTVNSCDYARGGLGLADNHTDRPSTGPVTAV